MTIEHSYICDSEDQFGEATANHIVRTLRLGDYENRRLKTVICEGNEIIFKFGQTENMFSYPVDCAIKLPKDGRWKLKEEPKHDTIQDSKRKDTRIRELQKEITNLTRQNEILKRANDELHDKLSQYPQSFMARGEKNEN